MENTNIGTTSPTYKVYNRQKYEIGVTCANGMQRSIKPGSFTLLTSEDIQYIDSICTKKKFFASGMLEPVDANNNPIPLEHFMLVEADESERVLTEDEISAALKKPAKSMQAWIDRIDDPVELHAIYKIATEMDLPASKLKILNAKMPNKDWLDEM